MLIESSETNSLSYPRLLIDANQIKWFKIHFLLLDFDWCPIEVTIALHFNWTSIGSLGWILSPHSSLMKCKAFHLRKGWVETHFPRDPNSKSFIWPTELHILFHFGAINILVVLFGVPFYIRGKVFWEFRKCIELSLPEQATSSRNPSCP